MNITDKQSFENLFPYILQMQELAVKHGVDDIFQDNGGKLLQILILLDLKVLDGRNGNDVIDSQGREYELKTININKVKGVSTHHHLNKVILEKYRKTPWIFALYDGIEVDRIYIVEPEDLASYFDLWEKRLDEVTHINNPKISISLVETKGKLVYKR